MTKDAKNLIVGLDIGTAKVMVVVAEVMPGGELKLAGLGVAPSNGLKRGVVVNIDATVQSIQAALKEAELMADYRKIAERRVRLGLVLGKLGEQNGITVSGDEVQRGIMTRARQFPGQEQQVFEFYSKNPQAQAEIRAPLFEDKVVDFIAELAQITDKKVDKDTLFNDPDDIPESIKAS